MVGSEKATILLGAMHKHQPGMQVEIIGEVVEQHAANLAVKTGTDATGDIDVHIGGQVPRTCTSILLKVC